MSFDLYLYKKKESGLTEEQVADYFTTQIPFTRVEKKRHWVYENQSTKVYFLMNWYKKERHQEFKSQNPEFVNLKFDISINYLRPEFFALEIFPIIDKLILDLDIYILNPQNESDDKNPIKFQPGYLFHQWIDYNKKILEDSSAREYDRLSSEKSNYIWRYQFNKDKLEESIVEDIYVPNCYIVKRFEDNKIYTLISWPDHIPIVLPKVDYIIVARGNEAGIVSYETIIKEFGDSLEKFRYNGEDLLLLRQNNADLLDSKWNNLKLGPAFKQFAEGIGWDTFVN